MRRFLVLLACAALPLALWSALPLQSAGSTASRAASLNSKIDQTRAQLERKRGTERLLTGDIASYSRRISALQGDITSLQRREARIQADLDAKRAELVRIQTDLRAERARLARLRARLAEARTVLARRLVELYKADNPDLVSVILNANGFADLLERGEFMRRIGEQDNRIIRVVRLAKADATSTAERLDVLEGRQQKVAAAVLARRNEVAGVKQQLVDKRVGYQRTQSGKQRALASVASDRQHLEKRLDDLEAAAARVTSQLQTLQGQGGFNNNNVAGPIRQGSGSMIWPVNGPVTSPFCERRAWEACHPGIDIGVPNGTPVRAAMAGRVILVQGAGASGGYGNFVCVQHTAAMSTCYAHLSSFAVSSGASVSQGQVVGSSGCTGRCFGPHLHFEVRINGAVTNPMNYL